MSSGKKILAVPTNVVTGFLGSGKTSAILNFLTLKPAHERWAVLINEFGEIGIDGSLLKSRASEANGVYVSEVPGGCMCCTAGVPMQVALTQLLRRSRPQRLLIEPTGLGHPLEVLQVLSSQHYRDVLLLQKTLSLVDARHLSDKRYAAHPIFKQQLEIADVVVANKEDLYSAEDRRKLNAFLRQLGNEHRELIVTQHGKLALDCLTGVPAVAVEPGKLQASSPQPMPLSDQPIPESGYIKAANRGDGYQSVGWRFSPTKVFSYEPLFAFLSGLRVERMKAVFITTAGARGYNMTPDGLTEIEIDDCSESRIEIVAECIESDWESGLMACIAP